MICRRPNSTFLTYTTLSLSAIAVMGALVPEALAAAEMLEREAGVAAEVVCVTSADLLFRSFQARAGLGEGDPRTLERLFRPRSEEHTSELQSRNISYAVFCL